VAMAPGLGMEAPADLVAGPALGPPRPGLAQPQAGGLLDDREHAETLHPPGTGHLQEPAPCGRARLAAADETAGLGIVQQFGVAIEVAGLRRPQDQPPGFDDGARRHRRQNALMPVSSRPITSWCTVSVPS